MQIDKESPTEMYSESDGKHPGIIGHSLSCLFSPDWLNRCDNENRSGEAAKLHCVVLNK